MIKIYSVEPGKGSSREDRAQLKRIDGADVLSADLERLRDTCAKTWVEFESRLSQSVTLSGEWLSDQAGCWPEITAVAQRSQGFDIVSWFGKVMHLNARGILKRVIVADLCQEDQVTLEDLLDFYSGVDLIIVSRPVIL